MPFWKFALATASCVLVTVPLQLGLGLLIGAGLGSPDFAETIRMVLGLVMLIVAITVCFAGWTRRYGGRRRAPRAKAKWLRRFRPRRVKGGAATPA